MNFIKEHYILSTILFFFLYRFLRRKYYLHLITKLRAQDALFLDVRTPQENSFFKVPQAQHIPLIELEKRINEIPINIPIGVFCHNGSRSAIAKKILKKNGYSQVHNVRSFKYLLNSRSFFIKVF